MTSDGVDWYAWHAPYRDHASALWGRLALVREQIRCAIDAAPPGPVRLVSVCAGQGHDVVGAARMHPRAAELQALLVELDPRNVEAGRAMAAAAGLRQLCFACGDATRAASYGDAIPADVVVLCGVLGNVRDEDIAGVVARLPELCAHGAQVVWTRHRRAPDMAHAICALFEAAGFEEVAVDLTDAFVVATHRLAAAPAAADLARPLFRFESDPVWLRRS